MSSSNTSTTGEKLLGQVKWFNNQLNYGFVTVISEGEHNNDDIFVHQTSICPVVSNYRTHTQGEYVSFHFAKNDNEKHPFHAINVTGVNGGKLMCDFYNPQSRRGNHKNNSNNNHSNNRNNNQ